MYLLEFSKPKHSHKSNLNLKNCCSLCDCVYMCASVTTMAKVLNQKFYFPNVSFGTVNMVPTTIKRTMMMSPLFVGWNSSVSFFFFFFIIFKWNIVNLNDVC